MKKTTTGEHESDGDTKCNLGLVEELEEIEIRGREKTIQTPAVFWLARIQRRVLET